MSLAQKRELIRPEYKKLSIVRQCKAIGLERSNFYYKPKGTTALNERLMKIIDKKHLEFPYYGVERMTVYLRRDLGYRVGIKRIRRLYKIMALKTLYPKRKLTQSTSESYKYPYLLKNIEIIRSNQVWEADITYIPMARGFMYMFGIIDLYSRKLIGWDVSNTMTVEWCKSIAEQTIKSNGKPEIFNTDQGSQFTSPLFTGMIRGYDIKISMDSKGRALDNIFIERFWRTIKYEHIYLYPANGGIELLKGIREYVKFYNQQRRHKSIGWNTPENYYENKKCLTNTP